jgi:outer membrane protein assembly factor BamB
MKKNKFCAFPILFILHLFLSAPLSGKNIRQENEIWTKPFKQCWQYQTDKLAQFEIASDNELVFTVLLDGKILALHSKTGETQWTTELGSSLTLSLQADKSSIYILNEVQTAAKTENLEALANTTNSELSLRSIDIASGVVNWRTSFDFPSLKTQMFLHESRIVLITGDGNIISVNSQDGKVTNEYKTGKEISAAYIQAGTITLGTVDKKLISISIPDAQSVKELSVAEIPSSIFLNDSGRIFWTSGRGFLNVTSIDSGRLLWTKKFGAEVSGVTDISNRLLITSLDNFIYFIDKAGGNILWKRRLAARITGKPFIRDKISVLSAFGDNTALFIDLKKEKVINSVSLSDANYFTGSPLYIDSLLVFPTLKGLYAFSDACPNK